MLFKGHRDVFSLSLNGLEGVYTSFFFRFNGFSVPCRAGQYPCPKCTVFAAGYFSSEILALLSRLPVSLFGQHVFPPACLSVFTACLARLLICLFRLYRRGIIL
jgi:hypothetical protein